MFMQKLKKKDMTCDQYYYCRGLEIFVKLLFYIYLLVNQHYFNISESLDILEMFTYQASFQLKQSPSS